MKRALNVLTLTALVVVVTATAGVAAWLGIGTGNASSSAASVQAGNSPTTSLSADDVTVSWSASTLSNGAAVDGYAVKRYSSGGALQSIGANCSGTIAGLSCTENDVPAGTWKYTVTPKRGGWTGAESAMSDPVTIAGADTTAPSATIGFPDTDGFYNVTGWNAGCATASTGDFCGTASDEAGGSGLNKVRISIQRGTGNYWGGSSFSSGAEVLFDATGTTAWSYALAASALTTNTSYTIRAKAADNAGNVSAVVSKTFTFDATAPAPVTPPATPITTANGAGTATKPDTGDKVTYVYSEPMTASSILSGWSGSSSTTVTVTIADTPSGGNDVLTVGGTNLGSLDLKMPDYVSGGNVTFSSSTIEQSGNSIIVTLGTPCTGGVGGCGSGVANAGGSNAKGKISWTPSASATDRAGNPCATAAVDGENVRNF